ncbi:MAG: YidC/Oxa1 family membrane protein insertase [Gemmatimonadaceae bacterium]
MLISTIIDLCRGALFALAHVCGGSFGTAIVVAAVAVRVVTLPLTLRATRRRLIREAKLRALAPEIAALKTRFAKRPAELGAAMSKLHESRGITLFDAASFVDSLLLYPPAAALYAAVRSVPRGVGRFLWLSDLVSPDHALAAIAAAVTALIAWAGATTGDSARMAQLAPLIGAAATFAILSHVSAGVALYSLTNSLFAGAEQAYVRRERRRQPQ